MGYREGKQIYIESSVEVQPAVQSAARPSRNREAAMGVKTEEVCPSSNQDEVHVVQTHVKGCIMYPVQEPVRYVCLRRDGVQNMDVEN